LASWPCGESAQLRGHGVSLDEINPVNAGNCGSRSRWGKVQGAGVSLAWRNGRPIWNIPRHGANTTQLVPDSRAQG
jgi:hypothetical protein